MRLMIVLTLCAGIGYAADANEDLLAAVRKQDVPAVKALLDKGADVNAKSPYGATPLFFAADRGNLEIIKLLLDKGADVNVKDTFYGATALTWAAEKGRIEIIKLLLARGAAGAGDVLGSGVEKGNLEMVNAALETKAVKPEELSAALMDATKANLTEIVAALKKAGAVPPPKADFQVDAETLQSYAGSYASEGGFDVKLGVVDGKLASIAPGFKLTLGGVNKTTFRPEEMPAATFTFNSEGGKVTSITFHRGSGDPIILRRAEGK